jgi:hypothetical protein
MRKELSKFCGDVAQRRDISRRVLVPEGRLMKKTQILTDEDEEVMARGRSGTDGR